MMYLSIKFRSFLATTKKISNFILYMLFTTDFDLPGLHSGFFQTFFGKKLSQTLFFTCSTQLITIQQGYIVVCGLFLFGKY